MQALSGSGREGIQLCTLVGRSLLSPDCILTKPRFRMFVYRVLCLEGSGRLFKISTDILENTRFVTLARPLTFTYRFLLMAKVWDSVCLSIFQNCTKKNIFIYLVRNPLSSPNPKICFVCAAT